MRELEPHMAYGNVFILSAGLIASAPCSAGAATKKVNVPDRYDGSWSITVVTNEGTCAPSTTYRLEIRNDDLLVPGEDIDLDGSVTSGGGVTATITKGPVKVPITGNLDPDG